MVMIDKIRSFEQLADDWACLNGKEIKPNQTSINLAIEAITMGYKTNRVVPDVDGGIAIEFWNNSLYHGLFIFNNGDLVVGYDLYTDYSVIRPINSLEEELDHWNSKIP